LGLIGLIEAGRLNQVEPNRHDYSPYNHQLTYNENCQRPPGGTPGDIPNWNSLVLDRILWGGINEIAIWELEAGLGFESRMAKKLLSDLN
jgi:hypothetical protein